MKGKRKTSLLENGMLWFGAGVSIAEILTGTYLAPLGMKRGIAAVILGHIIGCAMMFLAGLIGAKRNKSAMETVKMSFGQKGGILFSVLNVLQLVGWTAIMIYDGALAANGSSGISRWVWCLVIGILIMVWIMVGVTNLGKLNAFAMTALFLLTLVLCKVIFGNGMISSVTGEEAMSFGAAVELSAAMPLSWLPVISDYTREADRPVPATAVSVLVYGIVSCWMYVIGMGASIYTGESSIVLIMVKAGLGTAALVIIIFSTVTTTFLDAYSAGISGESIFRRWKGTQAGIVVTVVGTVAALLFPMEDITEFLYLIGSVFAPMIAVQVADEFLLKKNRENQVVSWTNLMIWLAGFILYRILMTMDIPVGNTLPDMVVVVALCFAADRVQKKFPGREKAKTCQEQGSML